MPDEIIEALTQNGFVNPTRIQAKSLAHSLNQGDMLCLSETGSGKTLSFILPILNFILTNYPKKGSIKVPEGLALILAPTRELCLQIQDYFNKFKDSGLDYFRSSILYGGVDCMKQVIELTKKPSIIVGTPGRVLYHL